MKVIKRDNSSQDYDIEKIKNALELAFQNSNTLCNNLDNIVSFINKEIPEEDDINIESIQDIVEKTLMIHNYYATAKHYIEYRNERNERRKNSTYISKIPDDIDTPWGMLGYITYKRTYSRRLNEDDDDDNKTEEFRDTILRVLDSSQRQLNVGFTNEELKRAYKYFMSLKCSVAGRFLWQLGTKTVDNLGIMSLQNCAFVKIDDPIKPFLWIFDVLMLGTGVGFSVQNHNINKIPNVLDTDIKITRKDTKDADFIVPDSREGWVALLEKVLEAFFIKGKSFSYSTILIRSAGEKIKGFGGTASGPHDLVLGINNIQTILKNRRGKKLSSVDCLDIVNIIASVVVAGNVRRCIPKGSMVHTEYGLTNIEDIKIGQKVLTSNGYEEVKNYFIQGYQHLITINTQDGEFKCTPNHRMAVLNSINDYEWKMAKDIKKDDILITSRYPIEGYKTYLPEWNYEKPLHSTTCKDIIIPELDEDISWLIGLFQADGYTYPNYKNNGFNAYINIIFGIDEYEMAEKAKELLNRFGDNLLIKLQKRKDENSYIVHCQSKQLAYYFAENIKQSKTMLKVPEYIKKSQQSIKLAYIAGILDGDGCVKNRPKNIVTSIYLDWVKELQTLCYSCGFETRLKIMKNIPKSREGWQPIHHLNIITKHSQEIICNIPQLFKKFKINNRTCNSNGLPSDMVIDYINSNNYNKNLKNKLGLYSSKQVVIDTFEKCFGKLNYCPVKVLNIEDNEEILETYDIEVENKHEFYCNGYLTHNSALLCIGDYSDTEYLMAKRWDLGNIPNWRCMSNNSVDCDDITKLPEEFWEGYKGNGEPYGLVNINLSKKIGRVKDGEKYPDNVGEGYNPCCEIFLSNHETCCLSEIFLPNITSYDELKDVATTVYRICKHSLLLKCHHEDTENIVHKNMRIGIGITGYMQCSQEQRDWLSPLYEYLREYDDEYSKRIGCVKSIKLTTCKPSGTLSILPGVTPGAHPGIYQYFIRRIRISSTSNLINICKKNGYRIEYQRNFDGTDDKNTMVVEFPCRYPAGTKLAKDMTAIDQLKIIKELQHNWSDNAVSVTIYYKLGELNNIKDWLAKNYTKNIKTCSFLLHNDHGFAQAPYEEIDERKYNELLKKVTPITSGNISIEDDNQMEECKGGSCPIK